MRVLFRRVQRNVRLAEETPQNENTRFHPRSSYGISKVTGFHLTRNYREAYNVFACNGILFNDRGFNFPLLAAVPFENLDFDTP